MKNIYLILTLLVFISCGEQPSTLLNDKIKTAASSSNSINADEWKEITVFIINYKDAKTNFPYLFVENKLSESQLYLYTNELLANEQNQSEFNIYKPDEKPVTWITDYNTENAVEIKSGVLQKFVINGQKDDILYFQAQSNSVNISISISDSLNNKLNNYYKEYTFPYTGKYLVTLNSENKTGHYKLWYDTRQNRIKEIQLDKETAGVLHENLFDNYYTFEAQKADILYIKLDSKRNFHPKYSLYNDNFKIIYDNTRWDNHYKAYIEYQKYELKYSGTYYLKIENTLKKTNGNYNLIIASKSGRIQQIQYNNQTQRTVDLVLPDLYRFTANKGETLDVKLTDYSFVPRVHIYDEELNKEVYHEFNKDDNYARFIFKRNSTYWIDLRAIGREQMNYVYSVKFVKY